MRLIQQKFNKIYREVFSTDCRYIDVWGGRGRGGSHFTTDYFLFMIVQPGYFRGVFMRSVFADIRGSLWQDFKDRVATAIDNGSIHEKDMKLDESTMNATYLPTGNTIMCRGFKKSSSTQSAKLKSLAGCTHVLIEECEEVDSEDFMKLDDSLRTTRSPIQIFRLFNPPSKNHWLIKRYYNLVPSEYPGWYRAEKKDIPELLSVHSTYLDNIQNIAQSTINNFRSYGDKNSPLYNEDFYFRDVCGLISEGKRGRIITKCFPITYKEFLELPYKKFGGIDFGYSNDPVAVVELKFHNNKAYINQLVYEIGMTDDDLAKKLTAMGITSSMLFAADSAEPKSIETLKRKRLSVVPALKGPDSIQNGIKFLQSLELYITENSTDIWNEVEEYAWHLDSNKQLTDTPIDDHNHAIDATRYGLTRFMQKGTIGISVTVGDEPSNDDMFSDFGNRPVKKSGGINITSGNDDDDW